MNAFRGLLLLLWMIIAGVTVVVVAEHGINLFPVFFGDIASLDWRGQFNVDFASYLTLSALWLMWRHEFSPAGIVLGVFGFFGGAFFLCAYLLVASFSTGGDMVALLLGPTRAQSLKR